MRQLLQITVEVDMDRGDDALTAARELLSDDWDRIKLLNEQPVLLRNAVTLQAFAR